MSEDLLPCPFCGTQPTLVFVFPDIRKINYVLRCANAECGAEIAVAYNADKQMGYDEKALHDDFEEAVRVECEAKTRWNRRASSS